MGLVDNCIGGEGNALNASVSRLQRCCPSFGIIFQYLFGSVRFLFLKRAVADAVLHAVFLVAHKSQLRFRVSDWPTRRGFGLSQHDVYERGYMNADEAPRISNCCQTGNVRCEIESLLFTINEDVSRNSESLAEIIGFLNQRSAGAQRTEKEAYSIEEFAGLIGRSKFTVAEKCREGRLNAMKTHTGRGGKPEWRISHDELVRYRVEGWLPKQRHHY